MNPLVSLAAAFGLVLIHLYIAGRVRHLLEGVPRNRLLSFASGVPVLFVFLQILPTLAQDQETLERTLGDILGFLNTHVYIVSFLGLATFYGVERVVKRSRSQQRQQGIGDHTSDPAFWLSITTFSVMNGIIGYLLIDAERSLEALLFSQSRTG